MFAALFSPSSAGAPALLAAARAFSPRVETHLDGRLAVIDAAGLGRIVGDAGTIARELRAALAAPVGEPPQPAVSRAEPVRSAARPAPLSGADSGAASIALAPTRIGAMLLAIGRRGTTVAAPGETAAAVGALGLEVFEQLARVAGAKRRPCALCAFALGSHRRARTRCGEPGGACTELPTLRRWGLATLGAFAALPAADLAARLGQPGVALQRLARGEDARPLVPAIDGPRFEASFDFEWPVADLQPLSFVLARLLEPLGAALERADRGASAIVTELTLVPAFTTGEDEAGGPACHVRRLELPAPMREARVLRTLILLDLESHPPAGAVERLAIRLEPTPGRIEQFSLLDRAGPRPETIATLVARLTALVGDGRVGAPALVDSHRPGAFDLAPFTPEASDPRPPASGLRPLASGLWPLASDPRPPTTVLRRFRHPVPARVAVEDGRPVRVTTDRAGIKGGAVEQCSGPWRSSGNWWSACGQREAPEGSPAEPDRRARATRLRSSSFDAASPEPWPRRGGGGAPRAGTNASACGPREAAPWSRDEYDVALGDGAAYRIYRDRHADAWFIEGTLD